MAFVSLILASIHMLTNDLSALQSGGFLQGYTPTTWAMVSLDSLGGLLVSMLLKYTTATLKNFAAPIGIILNFLFSRRALGTAESCTAHEYMHPCVPISVRARTSPRNISPHSESLHRKPLASLTVATSA